jgi:hypothetical protein
MSYNQQSNPFGAAQSATGQGCSETSQGCIRKSSNGSFYILNIKTRDEAVKQLAAIHA